MNDYTARIIHEDRTAQFRREADASRLASKARQRPASQRALARIGRLVGLLLARSTERPLRPEREPAKVMPAAD